MNHTVLEPEVTRGDANGTGRWMVIIYDNDTNSMDEVVEILMLATACTHEEASIEMWEAHTFGKTAVHFAAKNTCHQVALTIGSVGIKTSVTPEWEN